VLKNLLSNAFKFTEHGGVKLSITKATGGWSAEHPTLSRAPAVVACEVTDTGVGIPAREAEDHLRSVPAGRRLDQPQVRRAPGLGLAISRELSSLLGGEIQLKSQPDRAVPSRSTCR
jgi:signal transduction histidine kinase